MQSIKIQPGRVGNLAKMPGNYSNSLDKKSRQRLIKWGIIGGNILLLVAIGAFLIYNRSASQTVRSSTLNSAVTTAGSVANPLDQLSSAQIALTAAQMGGLPETTAIRNQADSDSLHLALVPNDSTALSKPQIVATAAKSKDAIVHYTTVQGDSLDSLSVKFSVSSDSISWSNNLTSRILRPGMKLLIPPGNGIVYQVIAGDTVASITNKYQADQTNFISVNDAENGVTPGEYVWIPGGVLPAPAPVLVFSSFSKSGVYYDTHPCDSFNIGGAYDCGTCTWWVALRWAQSYGGWFQTGLGNASSWVYGARSYGLPTSHVPEAGAAVVLSMSGFGHVGYVEGISSDGSAQISEMNTYGWRIVDNFTITSDKVGNYWYIYPRP